MDLGNAHGSPARAAFLSLDETPAILRQAEHGGHGPLAFRRLAGDDAFDSRIDFVDFTIIPPGSTIGRHQHLNTEEIYFVAAGTARIIVDDNERRLTRGDVSVVRSGQHHELINESNEPVEIFVVQVRV